MVLSSSRKAVIDWVKSVTGLSSAAVIWADQNMARPAKPYVTVKMSAFKQKGLPTTGDPDTNGAAVLVRHKDFTLQIQYFGDGTHDPLEKLLDLEGSLEQVLKYKILTDGGVVVVGSLMGPTDLSTMVDTAWERRGVWDLWARMPWTTTDSDQGVISGLSAEGTMMSVEGLSINVVGISITA